MPVGAAFQFAIPAPQDVEFTDGENAISVASPIGTAAARTTFHLAKWFDFEGGVYTIKCYVDDAATWIASVEQQNGRVLFSNTVTDGVAEQNVFIPRGRKRLDIILVNLSTVASSCYVAFSIWQYGKLVYASGSEGWVFDTAPVPDASIPQISDTRLTYPFFSVMPNWAGGILERLSWNTDVLPSEADVEQRRSVRRYPRRSFEASFLRKGILRARLDNFFTGTGKNECLIPLWHEQYPLNTVLASTLTFPTETLQYREFNVGDLVVVYVNQANYEILEISARDDGTDTLTFASAPVGTWGIGAKIMPLRVARVLDATTFNHLTDDTSNLQVRFELKEPFKGITEGSWGACAPLFGFKIDRQNNVTAEFDRSVFMLDNDTGTIDVTDPALRTRIGMRATVHTFGRRQMVAWRAFLQNARGRAVRFWFPDLVAHIYPLGDISGIFFDARDAGFADYLKAPQDARLTLAVVFKDGRTPFYRTIATVEKVGEYERFYVTVALPAIALAEIERITFVLPSRFDQDSFEIQHLVDDSAVLRSGIVVKTARDDGLPPIECFVTSKPYPLTPLDEMTVDPSIEGIVLKETLYAGPPEGIAPAADIVDGELREILSTYSHWPPESIEITSYDLVSGELRVALLNYEMEDEAMDVTPSIVGGGLNEQLITYEDWPDEAMDVTPSIVGGTLV